MVTVEIMQHEILPVSLLEDIENQVSEAWASVHKLESLSHYLDADNDYSDDEYEMEQMSFVSQLERIYISLCLILEALGYKSLLREFKSGFKQFEGKLGSLSSLPYIGESHSDVLGYFWRFHRSLSPLLGGDAKESDQRQQRALFESILQNTAKIVYDREIEPTNEADVRQVVYEVLIHVFPDTVREIPISQVTKTYKPDLGVRSLRAAAEYKYAVTEDEAKKSIGGFYEDMKGYAGSADWIYFYAVIYMTKPFFTLQQIQAEFSSVAVDSNWKPILVYGDGRRKRARH